MLLFSQAWEIARLRPHLGPCLLVTWVAIKATEESKSHKDFSLAVSAKERKQGELPCCSEPQKFQQSKIRKEKEVLWSGLGMEPNVT